ncbi:M14 family metallopeptidase [Alteribacter aurantiacus]|uniref:M14 family metallopeptidase n=1 Tax=Alteribacter aurantiacus TaxID=254410 RepID=UPI00146FA4D6|nr:M14 family metallopeptidase [Alteribacter aurantiacus]
MLKFIRITVSVLACSFVAFLLLYPLLIEHSIQYEHPDQGETRFYFPETYEAAKEHFLEFENVLRSDYGRVEHSALRITEDERLTIDTFIVEAEKAERTLMITTGVHGIEGYVGLGMLDVFFAKVYPDLDKETTNLILVHAVNPWGMEEYRRFNENNVDLNRNFIDDRDRFDYEFNEAYVEVNGLLEKDRPLRQLAIEDTGFMLSAISHVIASGADTIKDALVTGQFTHPNGVYYGGLEDEVSTAFMKELMKEGLETGVAQLVYIDLHTGYGPRDQMSIFNTGQDGMSEQEAMEAFNYPLVFAYDSDGFYGIVGGITEYLYGLKDELGAETDVFATTFEFGTLGEGTVGSLRSLKYTIDENQLTQQGAENFRTERVTRHRYMEMFYPSEAKWREKAADDFVEASFGVLGHFGFFNHQ